MNWAKNETCTFDYFVAQRGTLSTFLPAVRLLLQWGLFHVRPLATSRGGCSTGVCSILASDIPARASLKFFHSTTCEASARHEPSGR